jgi:tyrosine-protein kinase Etk/Wzc
MENKQDLESFFYVKLALRNFKHYWYLFALSLVAFLSLAVFINWYLQPVYEVGAVILINEDNNQSASDPSKEFMKSFAIFSPVSDIQREMMKMRSTDMVYKALKKTNAEITYFTGKGKGLKTRELYGNAPIVVKLNQQHPQTIGLKFQVLTRSGNVFRLIVEKGNEPVTVYDYSKNAVVSTTPAFSVDAEFSYGQLIESKYYSFKVYKNLDTATVPDEPKCYFILNNMSLLTYSLQKELNIEQVSKDVQAAGIKIHVKIPQKGIDLVNALTEAYLQRNIERKNQTAETTIQYFDNQLNVIEDSLNISETKLQTFKSRNKIMEMGAKADQIFEGANELEKIKAELEARGNYYKYINDNLDQSHNGSNLLVPSSMGLNDNVLAGIIDEYIKLSSEKNTLMQNKQSQSPYFNNLNIKLANQKNTLAENIKYLITTNNLQLASINVRLAKDNEQIQTLPKTQRQLVGIERKHKLNNNIYTYILEKKAEAQVAKASKLSDNDILESAKLTQPNPVNPNKPLNLVLAVICGLVFPFIGFGIKSLLNDTINDESTLQTATKFRMIGKIFHSKASTPFILRNHPRSAVAESFRSLRTNIDHHLNGQSNKVILITSTMSGEGKSFAALNIALSLALLNKKTVLLDFDLHQPKLHTLFNSKNENGISALLDNPGLAEKVIMNTQTPFLDFIPAGHASANNAAERISSQTTADCINQLKKHYDYIVIDTPPLGLISEAFSLMKYADITLYIIRAGLTPIKQTTVLLKELESKGLQQVYPILNDVDLKDSLFSKANDYFTPN